VLSRAFRRCHGLKSLWIKSGEYLFPDLALSPMWENDFVNLGDEKWDKRTSLSRLQDIQVAVTYYSSILVAVNASALPISTLRMDCMPIECFVDPEEKHARSPLNHLSTVKGAVANVQNLSVCFSGRLIEQTQYNYGVAIFERLSCSLAKNMASFISSMPLRTLELYSIYFPAWNPFILRMVLEDFDPTFPYLHSLTIERHPEFRLLCFLSRHSSTLRNLIVDARAFQTRPQEVRCFWKETMTAFRDNLKLDSFRIILGGDDYPDNSSSKLLKEFVLGAGSVPWPEDPNHDEERCHLRW
jgi:hypothetical protein